MKPGDFEEKLRSQSLREIPAGWRAEILSAAQSVRVEQRATRCRHSSWLSTINSQLSTLLWPNQKAWGALAAVWIFIFALNFSMRDKSETVAEKSLPPSPEMVAELKKQERLFAEWMGRNETPEAERPKSFLKPRSERMEILTA